MLLILLSPAQPPCRTGLTHKGDKGTTLCLIKDIERKSVQSGGSSKPLQQGKLFRLRLCHKNDREPRSCLILKYMQKNAISCMMKHSCIDSASLVPKRTPVDDNWKDNCGFIRNLLSTPIIGALHEL